MKKCNSCGCYTEQDRCWNCGDRVPLVSEIKTNGTYLEINGASWFVCRSSSPFVSRRGKEDVSIDTEGDWGIRHDNNNKRYHSCVLFEAETGVVLRYYEHIPEEINVEWLKDNGFIDNVAGLTQSD